MRAILSTFLLASLLAAAPGDPPLALVGGRVLTTPGVDALEGATVLIRDGRIEAVGVDLELPFDAQAVDVSGLTVAPAFVDGAHHMQLEFGKHEPLPGRGADDGRDVLAGMLDANRRGVAPEREAWRALAGTTPPGETHREHGFGAVLVAPGGMLLAGNGAWLLPSERPGRESLLQSDVAQFGSLEWRGRPSDDYEGTDYPATLMGVMAHLRQVLLDTQHNELMRDRWRTRRSARRPAEDPALEALGPVLRGEVQLVLRAQAEEDVRLALGLTRDFPGVRLVIAGGAEAWELADELAAAGVSVVLDADFPKQVDDPDDEVEVEAVRVSLPPGPYDPEPPLRLRRHQRDEWVELVQGAAVLREAGVNVAFGSFGRKPEKLLESVRQAIEPGGLAAADAFAALTTGPRQVFGGGAPDGELLPGTLASVAVWDGDPLAEKVALKVMVVDGALFDLREDGKRPDKKKDEDEDDDEEQEEDEAAAEESEAEAGAEPADELDGAEEAADDPLATHAYQVGLQAALQAADPAVDWPVELDADREPSFRTGGDVLVRGGTLLTVTGGTLPDTDMLVLDGRIDSIGKRLEAPADVTVVDATGRYVMPGVIDCHAHVAIRGGINEWTRSVTPEVTIEDEVDPDDVGIYRALAGGTTSARLLHGSANAIGGRHEVVKFRWDATAPEMVFRGAPRGVKFALGENPRQANWGGSNGGRFPKTRMGVEAVFRRSFEEARRYQEEWQAFADAEAAGEDRDPPRRDLRLEALSGVLDGTVWVHSHCYRAHEILMLMAIAEEFGFRVATFQHVLEGYKVGPELAAHGGFGGSTFVDWWGFKYEVEDATPYNPALVYEAGALMSVNSDSSDHIRRLQLEAAKTSKYGGVPEQDALAMVTLNPAIQLGIDDRVGSLDVGKDGDFAIFSLHPFDVRTRCLSTFVDGELMFERTEGGYDEWLAEVDRRVQAGRLAMQDPGGRLRPWTEVEQRSRDVDPAALGALSRPRQGTRALSTPPRPAPAPLAYVGGTLHTMDGTAQDSRVLEGGTLLLRDGRVESVSAGPADVEALAAAGYTVHDVSGLHVWPGLIDAGGALGLGEISMVRQSMDVREIGGDQADLRASTAWHPASEQIPVARVNGITSALAVPGGSGIRGQSSLMGLEGWTVSDAVVLDGVALHVNAPRVSREEEDDDEPGRDHAPHDQCLAGGPEPLPALRLTAGKPESKPLPAKVGDAWRPLHEQFSAAREYARVRGAAAQRGLPGPDYDPRLEALGPYALGQAPVMFHAEWADQIADVLDFAAAHDLRVVIVGGREAWKVADRLVLADVPVIVGPVFGLPMTSNDRYDAGYTNAALLHQAGVRIGLRTASANSARDLPYHAGMAVAFGLPEDVAMYTLTAGNAELLEVGGSLGRLVPGYRADVLVTDGSPLQIRTGIRHVVIGGRDVGLESKHTRLYETYRQRLRDPSTPSPER